MVPVRVPAGACQAVFVPEHADETRASFDEPSSRQSRLAEYGHAIGLAQGRRLSTQIQGRADFFRADHRVGHFAIAVAASSGRRLIEVVPGLVELLGQGAAAM